MNPPSAPHFSAAWERLVQMIKRVFLLSLASARLSRDLFVAETEGPLNGRPLTHVNSDIADKFPLTPNDFLLGRLFCTHLQRHSVTSQPVSCPRSVGDWWRRKWIAFGADCWKNLPLNSFGARNGHSQRISSKLETWYGYCRTSSRVASGHLD